MNKDELLSYISEETNCNKEAAEKILDLFDQMYSYHRRRSLIVFPPEEEMPLLELIGLHIFSFVFLLIFYLAFIYYR
jgi:hypothetical protein